ncbi:hypothetical protein PENSPDRAFT_264774 [Peniophora sp. CONT]|nr:hypothetical protein PENSPDRAFT_264774 [Peniophora sp. CONT]
MTQPRAMALQEIDSLPPEILLHIFWYIPRLSSNIHTPAPPWANTLHVCSKWRELSLGYSDLWVLIPLGNAQWTAFALQLSHSRPISIHLPNPIRPRHHDSIIAAMRHLRRAHSLNMKLKGVATRTPAARVFEDDILVALRDGSPNNLKDLHLSGVSLFGKEGLSFENTFRFLLNLRHLALERCFFSNGIVFPSTLVSLRLEMTFLPSQTHVEVLNLLQNLTLLEELSIICLPIRWQITPALLESADTITPIFLPNIRVLHLTDKVDVLTVYLRSLRVPLHSTLSLRIICLGPPPKKRLTAISLSLLLSSPATMPCYDNLLPLLETYLRVAASQHSLRISFSSDGEASAFWDVANMHVSIPSAAMHDHDILASLSPEAGVDATLTCENTLDPGIWSAMLNRTSAYLHRIVFPDFVYLSSCPLATNLNADLEVPNLREIAFTELQDMREGRDYGPYFPQLQRLLLNTTATVYFEGGVTFEDEQVLTLESDYPGRVLVAA